MWGNIKNINIALTNKCNLQCKHCDIWQEMPKIDLSLETVKSVLNSQALDNNVNITLTGGEPFLNNDFIIIVKEILKLYPNGLKTISTNGTLRNNIIKFLIDFGHYLPKDFSLHISLDGITKHNEQRNETLNKVINTINTIKMKFKYIKIKLKFTITPINYRDIIPTYNYAIYNKVGFKVKLVENVSNYTNKINDNFFYFNKTIRNEIIKNLLFIYEREKSLNKREAVFIKKTIAFLLGRKKKNFCKTPFDRIFLMPNRKIFSCIYYGSIGTIKNSNLDRIWNSKQANHIRNRIKKNGCDKCVSYHGFSL